jgi:tetratricopeptide (TPR) repeat protein
MNTLQDLMQRCLELFHRDRIAEADRLARELTRAFPDDGEFWQLHGLFRQREGDFDGACDALETASMLVPLSPAAQCALADCHARAGRRDLAKQLYLALADNRSCPTAILSSVASGLGCTGDAEAALEVCRELTLREPDHHEAYFGMAYYMRQLGRESGEILPLIARAHELSPEHPVYRVVMASLLAQLGNFEEACMLLRGVGPAAVTCGGCLHRIMAILDRGGAQDALRDLLIQVARSEGRLPEGSS